MKRLNDLEEKVLLGMHIFPNMWQDSDKCPPTRDEVREWCLSNGVVLGGRGFGKLAAAALLESIKGKIMDPDESDPITLEDEATWILSKSFSREQLLDMTDDEVVRWLQEWKYYFGFRKMEGWGSVYKNDAIKAIDGELVLSDDGWDIAYVEKEEV